MTPKLKVIPLGGLDEIGKNMTVYEFGSDIIVVDCGMGFPNEDMYGVDCVYPDITYLRSNKDRIRGIFLTHGHEDHIGAIAYVLSEIDAPIYTTPLTAALIELKLEEHDLLFNSQIFTRLPGAVIRLGSFTVEFIHVNHSIPDAVAFAITTPIGTVLHTGDYKIDVTPISGGMIDLARLGELGNNGVLAMLSDSTNVEKPGHTDSESKVGVAMEKYFQNCDKRIIITTFASNVHRLQRIIDVAVKYGRKIGVAGRSMENILRVCQVLGYMDVPQNALMSIEELNKQPKGKVCIISTGSQGEAMSALYRMAFSEHKQIQLDCQDRVIISASPIPGNESTISRVIDELFRKGVEVVYAKNTALHVSGHASQEELKMMLALVKPKYFMPVHGEPRMLVLHKQLAEEMGIPSKNIMIAQNGDVVEISKKGIMCESTVQAGPVMVDGSGFSEVGSAVLRDRHRLAEDGMVVVVMAYSAYDHRLLCDPEIITRGFIYVKDSEELMDEMKKMVFDTLDHLAEQNVEDFTAIKSRVKNSLASFLFKKLRRSPMILPVITEI